MDKIINTRMIANPFNWAIIYLVVVLIGVAIRTVGNSTITAPATAA
jgi:hypothetical protein